MAITTMAGLVAALASAQQFQFYQTSTAVAGQWNSCWLAGPNPPAGVAPSSAAGTAPTSATVGAIPIVNPYTGNTLYLAQASMAVGNTTQAASITFYDRVSAGGTLSGTVTTSQTVSSAALSRYTTGTGVHAWLEVYTTLGSTSVTATISYTGDVNGAGQSGTTTIPASAAAGTLCPFTLASGDTGVASVQSVTLSATTGTAGAFGITLMYDMCTVFSLNNHLPLISDYATTGLPVVQPNACLAMKYLPAGGTNNFFIQMLLAQG